MNQRILERIKEIANAIRPTEIIKDEHFHLSFAVRKGRIIQIGQNNYRKQHNSNKFGVYKPFKTTSQKTTYIPCTHSELNLACRVGLDSWEGLEIVNVRLNNNGELRLAKPCCNCQNNIINVLNPKRVFYSNSEGGFTQL